MGEFIGKVFIGHAIYEKVKSEYQHKYNDELENFENFMDNLDSDPISAKCVYEDSPSINFKDKWIEEYNNEDVDKIEKEISTYPNKLLVKQALSVINDVLANLSIDNVFVDEEPEQDYPDDDY